MNQQQTEQLTSIFREVFKDPSLILTPALSADDVERWDSLNHLTLIAMVEEKFGIKFKLKELVNMQHVGDLMTLIDSKLPA